ncbi:transglycosylase domain-containing protein [Alkalicoccus daliensis]|uniref:Penicillin-binding protein 1A n=1 Tax=Alkalicoccus daliensis TaxID=745820 RepID=A0A1H0I6W6_9BACI|nr:transglycosylase domain-containing protein [Alkalicoccus daliensis]SDO27103.1 penicillin-binding protein 1A [Alkalicoccus daliensis]
MRALMGFLITAFFLTFSLAVSAQLTEELSSAQTLHEVLDENIQFDDLRISTNSQILDRDRNIVSDIYSEENRVYLDYYSIPQEVINMFLAVEDRYFYQHEGFDINGIARALLVNLQAQTIDQGGSTITQQVARNLYLSHEQTYERKISELLYAYQLEREKTKEEILELYINSIYFANGVYGFESASQFYFNKSSEELSLAEIAYIGAIPNSPSRYDPLENPEATAERQEYMLKRMLENNYLTEEEFNEAAAAPIEMNLNTRIDKYPDYVTYVNAELKELISSSEGYSERLASADEETRIVLEEELDEKVKSVLGSGITINTALDPTVQEEVTSIINDRFSGSSIEAAASIIDHHQAEIVAITGGTNYNKFDFHRGYQSFRQPGSALKPLLSYAPYLNENPLEDPASLIDAGTFSYDGYVPRNSGGAVYGVVTLEEALKNSYNTAAVRLLHKIGIDTGFSYLNKFNFSRITAEDRKLPAALGGLSRGVSVNELTQAYTVFSNNGYYTSPRAIRSVESLEGEILYEWNIPGKKVYSEETSAEIRGMMRQVVTNGTGKGAYYNTSGYLGGKTGTTNDYNDLWFVGANSNYTAGVWLGKDQPESIQEQSRNNSHTNLWRDIMRTLE